MRGASYKQLMVFQTIVECGSIRAAARKLSITAPTVSQTLKTLEQHLGLPLFLRSTRRLELTEAGQLLYDNTTAAVSALNAALESVHDLRSEPSGKVRITLPRFVYQWLLRPIVADFCRCYPQIELEISIADATVNLLAAGMDLGIRFGDKLEAGMVARVLTGSLQEALFASPDYLQRRGTPSTPEDLAHHRQIQYRFITANQLAPLQLQRDGQRLEVTMPTALIVNDTDVMVDAAEQGLGIGRIIEPIVAETFEHGRLVPVLKDYWMTYPGLYLFYPQNSQKARRVRVFVDFLLERLSE